MTGRPVARATAAAGLAAGGLDARGRRVGLVGAGRRSAVSAGAAR